MAGLTLFGLVAYELLPVAALPTVDFPTIVVTAQLPGASPDTMASTVATPLEDKFTAIPGLAQMSSTSGLGQATITLQFDLSRNIDGAAGDVQTAINAASGLLPKNLPNPPTYRKTNPAERSILIYAVHSDAMPIYQLDTYANTILAQSLSTVSGVGQVDIAGQQLPAIHVQVDPQALAAHGLSLAQVQSALSAATLDAPKGNLKARISSSRSIPTTSCSTPPNSATSFWPTKTARRSPSKTLATSSTPRSIPRTGAWFDGKRAELLLIKREVRRQHRPGGGSGQGNVAHALAAIPRGTRRPCQRPIARTSARRCATCEMTLLITIGLVVLVIFAFLRTPWATAIPSVTVPLSLVATFGAMYLFGYSIDNFRSWG